jgi:hypothetical protein
MKRIMMLALAALAIFAVAEACADEVAVANVLQAEQPQMAAFQGGNLNDFKVWVEAEMAKRTVATKCEGRVIVAFKVMADGSIEVSDKPAMNSQADPELFAEVRRVVASSAGMWSAAVQNGKKVNVSLVVPVNCERVKAPKPVKKVKTVKKTEKKVRKLPALN